MIKDDIELKKQYMEYNFNAIWFYIIYVLIFSIW